jgi:hypothetical protein
MQESCSPKFNAVFALQGEQCTVGIGRQMLQVVRQTPQNEEA